VHFIEVATTHWLGVQHMAKKAKAKKKTAKKAKRKTKR